MNSNFKVYLSKQTRLLVNICVANTEDVLMMTALIPPLLFSVDGHHVGHVGWPQSRREVHPLILAQHQDGLP